jgi:hypothetical protein
VQEFLRENSAGKTTDTEQGGKPEELEKLEQMLAGAARLSLPTRTRAVADLFLGLLDRLANQDGRSIWIEKTPQHLHYLDFLESFEDPNGATRSDFVHVIRNGPDTVASLFHASKGWPRSYDLETCAKRWNRDLERSLERVASPRDHFVFYEELTAQPESTAERLFLELGLDWQPEILERYGETSKQLTTEEEVWKAGVARPIRPPSSMSALSQQEQESVRGWLVEGLYDQLRDALNTRRSELDD